MKNEITITLPYYDQPEMLKKQLEVWSAYPAEVAERVNVIIVDDGSPNFPAYSELMNNIVEPAFPISLYRINENIPWNHGGARNLAMKDACGWCIITDMDHTITGEDMRKLLKMNLKKNSYYMFARKKVMPDNSIIPLGRHVDSFLLTKKAYWNVGGYNEEFSGYWNGVSWLFRHNLKNLFHCIKLPNVFLTYYDLDTISDASVLNWPKKGSQYDIKTWPNIYAKYKKSLKNYKPVNPFRFTWEKLI